MNNKERALMVAEKVHFNQVYDIYPYMYHIRQVVKIAEDLGYDESIVVSCALHDALEDTSLSYNSIKKAFGTEVAEIVFCVTDELGRNRVERKLKTYPKIKSSWKATVVKICDRIANMSQSKEYDPEKYKMYKEEFENFYNSIHCESHPQLEVTKAWEALKKLNN